MGGFIEKLEQGKMSRRSFVGAGALLAATLGLAGCAGTENKVTKTDQVSIVPDSEGEWISVACWHNCGGGCVNRALVKDGTVLRQKTADLKEDTWDNPQSRACLRGRSQRKQVFNEGRLKYPMKRKNWEPDGGDKSLRGKDEWERISWDEALDYVAAEIMKVCESVGARGILYTGDANYGAGNVWKVMPGIPDVGGLPTTVWDTASSGSYSFNMGALGLQDYDLCPYMVGSLSSNDRFDLVNAETIVMYGTNPVWASGGNRTMYFMEAKKRGAEMIYVGPSYNVSAAALDARWIQVRPGTDVSMLLAVAYTMITEDDPDNNPLIDWEFLKKYTVGFTMDNLPAEATVQECFCDYVLGEYDGIPKTPEWATEICGTAVDDIIYLANTLRKTRKVMWLHSFAPTRNNGAENFPQLFLTLGCMGGHIGKSGHATGAMFHTMAGDNGPSFFQTSTAYSAPGVNNQGGDVINATQLWDAVLTGTYNYVGNPIPRNDWRPGEIRDIEIKMIYNEDTAGMQTRPAILKGIEAHRKVDFVVTHAMFMTTAACYADIVLPVISQWESDNPGFGGSRDTKTFTRKVCEPFFESRSDVDICKALMERLGQDPASVFPYNEKQSYMNKILGTTVLDKDSGEYVKMFTVSQEQLDDWDFDGEPQEGVVDFNIIYEDGYYQVERGEDDPPAYRYIAYQDFIADPENNPLPSKSGKFEIYCQWKADTLNSLGFGTVEFKPYPTYTVSGHGYEVSFSDWDNKVKGEYPFIAYEPHYLRRSHSTFNNVGWMREAFTNPVFLSASDAKEKGIIDNDTVLIWNEYGKILRRATVLGSIMPGCLAIPHGSWLDLDEETGIDHGGTDEVLVGPVTDNIGVSGYNNYRVNFEKYTEMALEPDCDWAARIVDLG